MSTDNALLSIGALSRVSGVGVETLRNWERRYGFPVPIRLESGHRRYSCDMVGRLRVVRRAIELGFKPSYAVLAPTDELEGLIREAEHEAVETGDRPAKRAQLREIDHWLKRTQLLDAYGFELALRRAWSQHGARVFICSLAVPYLEEVGERWARRTFGVAHEHFASEHLSSFFGSQWRPISNQSGNGRAIVANLEGEHHHIGIHMAAVFLALYEFEVVFLGPNTPIDDIVLAANEGDVVTTIIGTSVTSDVSFAETALETLRQKIPASITLVTGGNESIKDIKGVTSLSTLDAFADFVRSLAEIYRGVS